MNTTIHNSYQLLMMILVQFYELISFCATITTMVTMAIRRIVNAVIFSFLYLNHLQDSEEVQSDNYFNHMRTSRRGKHTNTNTKTKVFNVLEII